MLKKFKKDFKKYFIKKEDFNFVFDDICENNRKIIIILCSIFCAIFSVLITLGIFNVGVSSSEVPAYFVILVSIIVVLFMILKTTKKNHKIIMIVSYIIIVITMIYGLVVSFRSPEQYTVSFIALMGVIFMTFVDNPIRLAVTNAVGAFICIGMICTHKADFIRTFDLINVLSFSLLSLIAGYVTVSHKIHGYIVDKLHQQDIEAGKERLNKKEIEASQLLTAVKATYDMVVSVNLTKNTYKLVGDESFVTNGDDIEGNFDEVIDIHAAKVVDADRQKYYDTFSRKALLKAYEEGKREVYLEYQQCDEDGVPHWLGTHTMFSQLSDGADITEITISQNIDERIQKENDSKFALRNALLSAENANRAKSVFLSRMSHDIRTPMNAVIGYATIAAAHIDEKERVKDCLKKILSSGEHLQGLINDVLDMSRIESGKESLNIVRTSISELIRSILPMIQSQISIKHISLYIDTIDIKDEHIYADVQKVRQLLLNILSNAVKFTGDNGIISIKIEQNSLKKDGYALYTFCIKDNGIGMSQDFQEHVFETFSQEKSSTKSGQIGTGLGMAIAKNHVDMMNGTISVKSDVGKGTEFKVNLEFKIQEDISVDIQNEQLKGRKVLVVENDLNSSKNIVNILKNIGMNVDFTTTVKDALSKSELSFAEDNGYYAYIINQDIPDIADLSLVKNIKEHAGDKNPVIILTSYNTENIKQSDENSDVTAFCCKPLFSSDLINVFLEHDKQNTSSVVFKGEKILLVEDNEFNQEIAKVMLEEIGFEVDVAYNGKEAKDKLNNCEDNFYNYVLMDVQMPIMDGYEATEIIRSSDREYLKNVPIIALTANAFNDDVEKCFSVGMNAHLSKPFKIDEIITTLKFFDEKIS